jgi:hypothetical protein
MSMWDLPVPESPMRQSGWLFLIHSQLARVWRVAASMFGFASKSNARSDFSPVGSLDPPFRSSAGLVVAFGHQQFGEEAAVAHMVLHRAVGDVGELVADRGQPQQAAGTVDRQWPRPGRSDCAGLGGDVSGRPEP